MEEVYEYFNFLKAGDYKRAIEAGKKAVKKDPNNLDAHFCLGRSYYEVGEFKLSLEHMKRAESLASDKEKLMHICNRIGKIYHLLFFENRGLEGALILLLIIF